MLLRAAVTATCRRGLPVASSLTTTVATELSQHNLDGKTDEKPTFSTMLRRSKFFQLGDPAGKVVVGKIDYTIGNDLYIGFGFKFPCVCKRPKENAEKYIRGARVLLRIIDLELSSKFLGSERELTLLEADAILLGLARQGHATTSRKGTFPSTANNFDIAEIASVASKEAGEPAEAAATDATSESDIDSPEILSKSD